MPIPHTQEQIVAEETTQDFFSMPVCAGDTGFETRWARQCEVFRVVRLYEGQVRVLHAGETLTIPGQVDGYLYGA